MKNKILPFALLSLASAITTQAHATSTIIDFNDTTVNPSNNWAKIDIGGGNFFYNQSNAPYTTSTAIGGSGNQIVVSPVINGFNSAEHIHVGGPDADHSLYTHTDTGGIYFDILPAGADASGANVDRTLNAFAFQSMDIEVREFTGHLNNTSYTIKGYKGGINGMNSGGQDTNGAFAYVGGTEVASVTLTNGTPLGVFDFLAADSGFGDVDHVEMYFSDFYRQSFAGTNPLYFEFDNVTLSDAITSPVPVPAAAWLFGSGLLGLASFTKRKKSVA